MRPGENDPPPRNGRTPSSMPAEIDHCSTAAGWAVQDSSNANIHAGRGVAIREFQLATGHGSADYLLYVDGKAAGVIEAKKEGATLTGVEAQSAKYAKGLPDALPAGRGRCRSSTSPPASRPFTNGLDPSRAPARLRLPPARDAGRLAEPTPSSPAALHAETPMSPKPPASTSTAAPRSSLACGTCRTRHRMGRRRSGPPSHRRPQPRKIPRRGPPARADPDGHRQRQDLHRRHLHLPADQVRRRAPRPLPGRPRQPRPPDAQGVPAVRHARRRPQVHRAVHRPAPHEQHARPGARVCITHHPAPLLDAQGRASSTRALEEGSQFELEQPRSSSRSRSTTTRRSRSRPSTSSSPTNATARSTTSGAQVLEYFDAYLIGLTATPSSRPSASSTRTS